MQIDYLERNSTLTSSLLSPNACIRSVGDIILHIDPWLKGYYEIILYSQGVVSKLSHM